MSSKKHAKRIILVDRSLQFRYARLGMGVGLISTLLTATMILYPLYYFKILVIPTFLPLPIMALIIGALVFNMLLVGFFGILISHRIAGPVFAMVRLLRSIQDGRFTAQLRLRNEDDLQYLAKHFNETSEALIAMTKKDLETISNLHREFPQKGDPEKLQELAIIKARLEKRIV